MLDYQENSNFDFFGGALNSHLLIEDHFFVALKPLFQLSYFSIWWGLFKILIRLMYTTNFEVEGGNLQ